LCTAAAHVFDRACVFPKKCHPRNGAGNVLMAGNAAPGSTFPLDRQEIPFVGRIL